MPGSTTTRWGLYKPGDGDGTANGAPWGSQLRSALDTLDEAVLSGPLAARPAAGVANRVYFATDTGTNGKLYIDDGAAWNEWTVPTSGGGTGGSGGSLPPWWGRESLDVPLVSDFTWLNKGTASAVDKNSCLFMNFPSNSGDSIRALLQSLPAGGFQVDLAFIPWGGAAFNVQGVVLYDSVSGKIIMLDVYLASGGVPYFRVKTWNSITSSNSTLAQSRALATLSVAFMRVVDDGSNRSYSFSLDGQNYETLYTHASSTWIAPDFAGFGNSLNDTGKTSALTVIDWAVS